MNTPKFLSVVLLVCLFVAACAQTKPVDPKISVTKEKVFRSDWLQMKGTGFTPDSNIVSHLRRPDGTEFPTLHIQTNERGEFTHDIDSLLLSPGVFELWVEDLPSKKTSNTARFEVSESPQK
jgi:hypothetical protein